MALYLLDTDILLLLRLVEPKSSDQIRIRKSVESLWDGGDDLCYTSQNLAEFWNVCTRPASKNGFGLSIEEADQRAALLEKNLIFLPDSRETHEAWRAVVVTFRVAGVQVHDARLVAAMGVYQVDHLLT